VRLWINDYWREAVAAGCFGVHLGQEDLLQCIQEGGLSILKANKLALGVSTHSFGELAVALGVQPSYISLGPIYATSSKKVDFAPQGLAVVHKWRQLIPSDVPLVVIGGISTAERATSTRSVGADCVAVIGAITDHGDNTVAIADAMTNLNQAML
jgi:thiamine-phosphate diphosphorylase